MGPIPQDPTSHLDRVRGDWRVLYTTIEILGSKRTKLGLRQAPWHIRPALLFGDCLAAHTLAWSAGSLSSSGTLFSGSIRSPSECSDAVQGKEGSRALPPGVSTPPSAHQAGHE